jgi:hypothetical protein
MLVVLNFISCFFSFLHCVEDQQRVFSDLQAIVDSFFKLNLFGKYVQTCEFLDILVRKLFLIAFLEKWGYKIVILSEFNGLILMEIIERIKTILQFFVSLVPDQRVNMHFAFNILYCYEMNIFVVLALEIIHKLIN